VDDEQVYPVAEEMSNLTTFLLVASPIFVGLTVWFAGNSLVSVRPPPWESMGFRVLSLVIVMSYEAAVLWLRNSTRGRLFVLSSNGLAIKQADRARWQLAWAEIDSIQKLQCARKMVGYDQMLVIRPKVGKARAVPLRCRSDEFNRLLDRIRAHGLDVLSYAIPRTSDQTERPEVGDGIVETLERKPIESFELVDRKRDVTLFVAIIFPFLLTALIWLLGTVPESRSPHPWTNPVFTSIAVFGLLAFEAFLFWSRSQILSSRIHLTAEGITFVWGKHEQWSTAWNEVVSVTHRKYWWTYRSFREAFVIELTSGEVRLLPCDIGNVGPMPRFHQLMERFKSEGFDVKEDSVPKWFTT
jgi:hypothetical protein